jgi:hypothetical protein
MFLLADCEHWGMEVKASLIGENSGRGLFTLRDLQPGDIVCSLNGVLFSRSAITDEVKRGGDTLNQACADRVQELDTVCGPDGHYLLLGVSTGSAGGFAQNATGNHPTIKQPNVKLVNHPMFRTVRRGGEGRERGGEERL